MASNKVFADGVSYNMPGSGMFFYDSASSALYMGQVDSVGNVWVNKYDRSYQLMQSQNIDAIFGVDIHDAPSILVMRAGGTNAGKVLAVYNHHAGVQYSNLSTAAGDIRQWAGRVQVTDATTAATFNCLYQANDTVKTVFLIYSQGTVAGSYTWGYKTSTNGTTWSAYVPVLVPGFQTPIVRPAQDPANPNIIHWIACPNLTGVQYHFYMVVQADGSVKWYKSDGTEITGTLGAGWTGWTNFTQVVFDATSTSYDVQVYGGNPAFIYATYVASGSNPTALHTYRLAKWTGSAWTLEAITGANSAATGESPSYAGPDYRYNGAGSYSPGSVLDPNDVNTAYLSIAFASNYSPALPSQATSGNLTDARAETWTKSGGTWAKTADISGATSSINYTRATFQGLSPTVLIYASGTEPGAQSYLVDIWAYPALALNSAKPASPIWTPSRAPINTQAYYLLYEGSGSTLHDVAGTYNGTTVGSPTWGSDSYGANLSGFTTSNYGNVDALAAAFSTALSTPNLPVWISILYKNTGTATGYAVFFGHSTETQSIYSLLFNSGGTNIVQAFIRSSGGTSVAAMTATKTAITDGNYHVISVYSLATNSHYMFLDGVQVANSATNWTSALTLDRGTIGAARQTGAPVNPFPGTLSAVDVGWGGSWPDAASVGQHASYIYKDLITGQFGGTRAAVASNFFFFTDQSHSGGFWDGGY